MNVRPVVAGFTAGGLFAGVMVLCAYLLYRSVGAPQHQRAPRPERTADAADQNDRTTAEANVLGRGRYTRHRMLQSGGSRPEFLTLHEAIASFVKSGDSIALEGFTHLIPFAAGHEIIRQHLTDLTLIRMTPDLLYDQMIGAGCAQKLVFSWGGNPGVGSLHRLRDAVEREWPRRLEIEEHSHAAMAGAYAAGAAGLPCAIFRGYLGSDLAKVNPRIRAVECPFTGEKLAAVPAHRPDVTIIHAQKADRRGNVLIRGIIGVQKEAVLAARRAIVTVEELVDELGTEGTNAVVLPSWTLDAIVLAPGGARPSYAHGYYQRNNAFYMEWDAIARDRERFQAWLRDDVMRAGDTAPGSAGS